MIHESQILSKKLGFDLRKAIVVSPMEYFQFFEQVFTDWDVQHPVLSIDQMWDDLGNETLDELSEIVVLNDEYHSPDSENLELAIITLAADALVLIVADDDFRAPIEAKVQEIAQRQGINVAKYWFVSRENPMGEINEALEEYETYSQTEQATEQHVQNTVPEQNDVFGNANDEYEDYGDQFEQANPYANNPYLNSGPTAPDNNSNPREKDGNITNVVEARQEAEPAYQFVRSNYEGDGYEGNERNGMIIASTSSKGGSGKSTVGICTASMIYHASRLAFEQGKSPRPLDVIIVDMDTRDGQIGFFLGETTPTVLNIFTSQDFSRNNIRKKLIYNERLGISALLAPKRAKTADYTTPEFYRDIISKLQTMFDVVILDTSVNYTDPLIYDVILPVSDAVLFVTDMSKGAVFGMTRWIAEVTLPIEEGGSAAISKDKIGVVVNKSMGNVGFDQRNLVEAASGVPLIASIPMDSGAVLAATNNNHLDDIVLKHPVLSPSYFSLAKQIIQDSVALEAPETFDPDDPIGNKKAPVKAKPPLPGTKKKKLFGK